VATPFQSDLYVLICRIEEKDSRQHMQELKVIIRYFLHTFQSTVGEQFCRNLLASRVYRSEGLQTSNRASSNPTAFMVTDPEHFRRYLVGAIFS
jgi:hypothetical protein